MGVRQRTARSGKDKKDIKDAKWEVRVEKKMQLELDKARTKYTE